MPLPSRRYLVAVLLGLVGLWLNQATVSLLTQETPQFVLGGSVVLLSFVALGTGPGILTALLSLASFLAHPDAVNLATLVYLVEAWAACLLYRRFGSLIFAEALYWFTGGLALTVLVFGGALGLQREYVTLLFIKQVFNGILNALIAEAFLRLPGRPSWLPARDSIVPFSLKQYVFNRVVFVVMIPALGLAILLTRSAYEGRISEAHAREQRVGRDVGALVRDYLTERETAIERLGRRIEMEPLIEKGGAGRALTAFLSDHPEFINIGVADPSGRVLAIRPEFGPRGEVLAGRSIEGRPYFREVRERLRTAYSNFVLGTLHVRDPEKPEGLLVIAEPLFGRSSELRGVLFASLRAESLAPLLDTGVDSPVTTTLFDPELTVIASQDPRLPPGKSLSGFTPVEALAGETARSFSYFPPPDSTPASELGINLRQSSAQRLSGSGMGLLVDLPAEVLHRDMMPTAYRILLLLLATLALLYAAVSRFASRVSRPLQALNAAANEIAAGRFPREGAIDVLGQSPIEEIQNVALHFLGMRDALAYRDALTGLPNRQLFLDRLSQAVAQARRSGESLAVLFLDFDRFRMVEDSMGHSAGNDLLRKLAQRLQRCVREGDTVARLAADEFAVLVHHVVQSEDAAKVAAKLLDAVRPPVDVQGRELSVTASLGIACFPADGDLPETLLKNADTAMYRAKGEGRDTYRLYHHAMNDRALEQLSLESALRKAISQGNELTAYYQPLVSLASGRIEGAEALVRWNHPERGLLGAGQFISVAEASGLIVAIDNWMLYTACAQARDWRAQGYDTLRVEVNLSARQFQLPDLVAAVTRCLQDTGLPPEALEIEITESIAMRNVARSAEILRNLREQGVRISLDDFGTGYSSLSYLKTLPVDTVKLDQSFVRDITTDRGDAAIATAIIAMAHTLGLRVVAEGVETEEQLSFLRAHGCDTVQGFLLGPPVPPGELLNRMEGPSPLEKPATLGDSSAA
jgi:diguanylate cyclase (GGDEF)-like protein